MATKLLDLLPRRWGLSRVMRGLAEAVGRPLDQWRATASALHIYFDPWSAPAAWLPWLAQVVALPVLPPTDTQRRAVISAAFSAWPHKGTPGGIEVYLKAVAGIEAEVVRTNQVVFVAGFNVASDPAGPGENAWHFEVHVPPGTDEQNLRRLLHPVVPGFDTYDVVEMTP
ncbi:MAG: phage tail protein [Phycisphaerales bacterium JB052]